MTELTEDGFKVTEAACCECAQRVELSNDKTHIVESNFIPQDIQIYVFCDEHKPESEDDVEDLKQRIRESDIVLPGVIVNLGMPEPVNEK